MMKGEENCAATTAAPDFKIVRRSIDQDRRVVLILFSQTKVMSSWPEFFDALWEASVTLSTLLCQLSTREDPATFGLGRALINQSEAWNKYDSTRAMQGSFVDAKLSGPRNAATTRHVS
jgi:hypothetical protein